jgi:hypothetical protein
MRLAGVTFTLRPPELHADLQTGGRHIHFTIGNSLMA